MQLIGDFLSNSFFVQRSHWLNLFLNQDYWRFEQILQILICIRLHALIHLRHKMLVSGNPTICWMLTTRINDRDR